MKSIDLHGTPKVLTGAVVLDGIIAVCAMVLTMGAMARLIPIIRDQLVAPFDLISEGPHLQLMIAVRDGFNIYAPESHLDSPFRLVPYLPFYHAVIAMLPADPANPFFTGRVVAMLFLFAAASSVFAVAPRRDWLGVPLAAFASFFLVRPIVGNTAYFRSDHAGVFFSVMAILTIARAPTRRGIILAAFFSAIALACKQAFVAASVTCFLLLIMRDRRACALFVLVFASVVGTLAALATLRWGRGFWYCILLPLTHYPRDLEAFFQHWNDMWKQPVFTFIAATTGGASLVAFLLRGTTVFTATPYFMYFVISLAVQTRVLSGVGAANHYFVEPILAVLLWLVWLSTQLPRSVSSRWILAGIVIMLSVCGMSELRDRNTKECRYTTAANTAAHGRNRELVIEAMNRLGIHGELLNLKDSPVTCDYAREGRINVDDPYLFMALWDTGGLSTEPLLHRIRERYFDAVIVQSMLTSDAGQDPNEPVQNIIHVLFQYYQVAIHGNDVNILTPRTPSRNFAQ